jgi:hypothetical protein
VTAATNATRHTQEMFSRRSDMTFDRRHH